MDYDEIEETDEGSVYLPSAERAKLQREYNALLGLPLVEADPVRLIRETEEFIAEIQALSPNPPWVGWVKL